MFTIVAGEQNRGTVPKSRKADTELRDQPRSTQKHARSRVALKPSKLTVYLKHHIPPLVSQPASTLFFISN